MRLGVIGYGLRIGQVLDELKLVDDGCRVAAITDVRYEEIRDNWTAVQGEVPACYESPEEMLANERLDGVLIGTRCSLHTEMALKVLPTKLPLFLEKPVATHYEDLLRLKRGFESYPSPVLVSFPLRASPLVSLVKEVLESGKIGTIEHVQAVNNVPYGGVYFHYWYRDERETGGLFLQKATHDFDYLNHLIGQRPVSVCAMVSKQIFKGDRPAGLKCADCEDNGSCPESTVSMTNRKLMPSEWEHCCFSEDTGNEDSGSAIIKYESGMHMSYSQNFFARRKAGSRGARLLGYKGTLEFDFYTNEVKVFMHHQPRVETYTIDPGEAHFGGDAVLAQNFIGMMKGIDQSASTLESGLTSALMCLRARESAQTHMFQDIAWS
ncbi:Gfo/Idh/MocA family protein [Paenibacillus eucommiae]|uniref:Dehydrogenase n=1 Tax=Paenibacillus eucommiae TaxID=1355755 RepID=A0ABS4IXU1_9BACL|nr:Gfo/Idh/MocA family oxidoreductase [Paenibacillus eucommiae]MBP1992409.1 putative dehydrogenase [Paenibacillus eucommiae]